MFKRSPTEVSIKREEVVKSVTPGEPNFQQLIPPRLDIQRAEAQFFNEIVPENCQESIVKK